MSDHVNKHNAVPERDRDAVRRIGFFLEGKAPLVQRDNSDEDFLEALADFRTDRKMGADQLSSRQKEELWKDIATTAGIEQRKARIFSIQSSRLVAAVAASLLLAGVLAFLLLRSPSPDVLATADTTSVTHVTEDGVRVTLRPHSQLVLLSRERDYVRYGIDGEAYFEVEPADQEVQVDGRSGRVRVLGTSFNVRTWGDGLDVYLQDGLVQLVDTRSGESRDLAPGQRARLTAAGELLDPEEAPRNRYLGWMENELRFEEEPLQEIVRELEYHHRVTIDIPQELAHQTLTGRILLEDIEASLEDLGMVMDGEFRLREDGTFHFEAN